MLASLALAALLSSAPTPASAPASASADASVSVGASGTATAATATAKVEKPKRDPDARLAQIDQHRVEMHLGVRGYGRFLDADPTMGASVQLGLGVRLVRGLHFVGELGAGAHGLPFGVGAQAFLGLQHEFRFARWIRPSVMLGYSHLVDATFDADFGPGDPSHDPASCKGGHGHQYGGDSFGFDASAGAELASRPGVQAGVGLRFPMRFAPRLSLYLRGDVGYYFDDRPGRLQAGGTLGAQIVF